MGSSPRLGFAVDRSGLDCEDSVDKREPETKDETQGQQMEIADGKLGMRGTQANLC